MDRRTLKTRHALYNALLRLLTERAWEEVDVQSLCDLANVGRSTFYGHFPNREQLLQECFADICQEFSATGLNREATCGRVAEIGSFVAPLLEHIGDQRPVFQKLLGRRSNAYVRQQFQLTLTQLFRVELDRRMARPIWRADLLAHSMAGATLAAIQWWIHGNQPRKPEEITQFVLGQVRAMAINSLPEH